MYLNGVMASAGLYKQAQPCEEAKQKLWNNLRKASLRNKLNIFNNKQNLRKIKTNKQKKNPRTLGNRPMTDIPHSLPFS